MPVATDCTSILSPLDPAFLDDPYATYCRLRRAGRVLWHETLNSWVVTSHRDCARVLRDERVFGCDSRRAGIEPGHTPMIQLLDGAAHREVRSVVTAAIGRRLAELDPVPFANTRMSMLAGGTGFCLVDDYAFPFALDCLNATLRVPVDTTMKLCQLMTAVVRSMSPQLVPDAVTAGEVARAELNELLNSFAGAFVDIDGIVASLRGQDPGDDGTETVLGSIRVACLASINSVSRAIGLAALHLLALPREPRTEIIGSLRRTGSTESRAAVEELVRYDAPVQAVERFVSRPVRLAGVRVERGQRVTLLLGSANRDASVFSKPDVLNVRRIPNPHLGWGSGPHACLGSRIGVRHVAAALAALFGSGDVIPLSPPRFDQNPALRGLESYAVRVVPGRRCGSHP